MIVEDLPSELLRSRMRKMMRYLNYSVKTRTAIDHRAYTPTPSVEYICFDRNLRFWIETTGNGVFEIPPPPSEKLFRLAYETLVDTTQQHLTMMSSFRLMPHMKLLLKRCYHLEFLPN